MSHQAPKTKRVTSYTCWLSMRPQLSLARQLAVIRKFATQRGMEIVMAYSDWEKGGKKR
jgi:hypothetical protein